jgi:hypothetical protein
MAGIPGASFFTRFLGRTVSEAGGVSVGLAAAPAVRPLVQELTNLTWAETTALGIGRPLSVGTLASGVAQGQIDYAWAVTIAGQGGTDKTQFDRALDAANIGPGLAEAYRMWRRGTIKEPGFRRAVKRLGLEQEWIDDLVALKDERLSPAEIAVMVQRGVIPDPGYLPVGPPTRVGKVPPMPVEQINATTEAEAAGVDESRIKALTRIIGLPASPDLAARMTFRGIIDSIDFDRAISEGNTRNEWAPFLFDGFREIPTVTNYIEGRLRAWLDDAQMYAGTAKHGMSKGDTDLLFKVHGRPISFRQVFIGERRGGIYNGSTAPIDPHFLKSLQESNIRPEWYDLAWAQRETFPSAFVVRALLQGGVLTADEGDAIFRKIGWPLDLARKVADHYGAGTGTVAVDPLVKSAHTRALTLLRNAYVARRVDDAFATDRLNALGVAAAVQTPLLDAWRIMQTIPGAGLTRAQVKKAFKSLPVEWPRDRALTELEDLGMEPAEAQTYLDE